MPAIGIDLGTTFSVVAYMKSDSQVEVVMNHHGNKITPSVVHFSLTGKVVGEEAQARRATDPTNTIYQVKRIMGRRADDPKLQQCSYPFEIVSTAAGDAAIRVTPGGGESKIYCPEEISAIILKYEAAIARAKMGLAADMKLDAVITATKDAGEMAGLNVLRIINEPTAAALAYGFGTEAKRTVLVYDLGGGTFDVSILKCKTLGGKVLSTAGVTSLGGEDFDHRLYEYVCAEFRGRGITITDAEKFGLYKSCEEAKVTLSNRDRATISLFRNGQSDDVEITRQAFEELCIDLFEKTIECMDEAINEAGIPKEKIDDVVLVGGSSRIPKVRQMVRDFFGDRDLRFNIPPDHAVACGAAILAESLSSGDSSSDESSAVRREERSALRGAVRLADVLPISLGTNVSYDTMSVILRKNTPYPTSSMECYSNGSDSQTEMIFKILEGENARCSENRLLGVCTIPIPKRTFGENTVVSIYSVDENGILSVHLRDLDTAEEASMKVQTSRLTVDERMAMVRNALKEEESERVEKAKLDARTAFGDAITAVKRSVHRTESAHKKLLLHSLIAIEEKWIDNAENPSNDELTTRAGTVKKSLAEITKS